MAGVAYAVIPDGDEGLHDPLADTCRGSLISSLANSPQVVFDDGEVLTNAPSGLVGTVHIDGTTHRYECVVESTQPLLVRTTLL